jgi:hypothetical protein
LDSLRFVACARPACGQVFFLCVRCDRGHRYCGRACASVARRAGLRAAGERYQRSFDGRATHALRQQRYRERRRAKVTHHRREVAPSSAMVRASQATSATEAQPATEILAHGPDHPPPQRRRPCCARCGAAGWYVRHDTLARTGRPHQYRRLRRA